MNLLRCVSAALMSLIVLFQAPAASAQDLYDPDTLRTFNLQFHDANWLQLLRNNYISETLILADLTVDGVTYPNVGVRIRGNTSYTQLPSGSEKFSLKIHMDHVDPNQEILGYDNLNLNNGFRDPTFTREVVFNNYVAQFIPNPRANHVLVTLNGQNWGVYINVQQGNKRMLRDYFTNADGMRITCSNNPNGPGLAYNGPNASGYSVYEINNDGGLADPLAALIDITYALSNEPLSSWQNIDHLFAIDPSIWSVVLENMLTDDDSYVNKGCDFAAYRDPIDGRLHLYQRDGNETFSAPTWAINRNFTQANKPVLSRVLAVPELRQRYMAHYRTAKRDLSWDYFGSIISATRARIESHVQADPKKIYTYAQFQNNFTNSVSLGGGGVGGGTIVGLQQFVTQRLSTLNAVAELVAPGPTVADVQASAELPSPDDQVFITATVTANTGGINKVELFYRPAPEDVYLRVPMLDDGQSGDGAAGDGVFGALLPVSATPGQKVAYYVGATAGNPFQSVTFLPERTERGPAWIEYGLGEPPTVRITEWAYSGASGEFIELTNLGDEPIDFAGWSVDDDHAVPGAFDLSAAGVVQPGQSVIVTDVLAVDFRTAWSLDESVVVIGELGVASGNNLGRNDQIHVFDGAGNLVDRLFYGDQTYPGSIRTQNASGQTGCAGLGQNDVLAWTLSVVGDAYGSVSSAQGDIGTPGRYPWPGCLASDVIFADGFESQ